MEPRQAADFPAVSLARRARSVDRSSIRLMFDLAGSHDDNNLVHLEIGEPDFDTPDHIVDAANDAAESGETHYTSNAGLFELREAIATDLDGRDVDLDPETEITVTTGAMEALLLALLSVADPGEEVIIPTPAWPNYRSQVKLADATPVELPLSPEDDFALDPKRVEQMIDDETAAIVLTSPSNPTGQVYEREAVIDVIETALAHDVYVIADEVYAHLVYGDQPTGIAGYVNGADNVLTVGSCSKTYSMTGWRVGWLTGPERVIDAATKLHENTTACAPSVSQHAAIAALEGPDEPVNAMQDAYRERRDYFVERISDIPAVSCVDPDGAFYTFVDVSQLGEPSLDIAKRLLNEQGVVTAPGSGFGDAGEGHLRMSFAKGLDRLETGLDRFETFVRNAGASDHG